MAKTGIVLVAVHDGTLHGARMPVRAEIYGALAVHRYVKDVVGDALFLGKRGWTITHIHTGFALAKHIGRKDEAVSLAQRFRDVLPWDDFKTRELWMAYPKRKRASALRKFVAAAGIYTL